MTRGAWAWGLLADLPPTKSPCGFAHFPPRLLSSFNQLLCPRKPLARPAGGCRPEPAVVTLPSGLSPGQWPAPHPTVFTDPTHHPALTLPQQSPAVCPPAPTPPRTLPSPPVLQGCQPPNRPPSTQPCLARLSAAATGQLSARLPAGAHRLLPAGPRGQGPVPHPLSCTDRAPSPSCPVPCPHRVSST